MMRPSALAAGLATLLLLAGAARADDWHTSLADGLAAAGKSGKPVLLVTLWPPNV